MDKWITPDVNEVEVAETEYGGKVVGEYDKLWQNDEGNWEGTFKS